VTSFEEVQQWSEHYQVVPVVETYFSGTETPLSIFEKLSKDKIGGFLLESAEQGVWSRYSFIGVGSVGTLLADANGPRIEFYDGDTNPFGDVTANSGLNLLDTVLRFRKSAPVAGLPPFVSGLVGLIGWDMIQEIEKLPERKPARYKMPDLAMSIVQDLVVVDHLDSSIKLISNIFVGGDLSEDYARALSRIDSMRSSLLEPTEPFIGKVDFDSEIEYEHTMSKEDFLELVSKSKKHVVAGDVFQVVLSQRFETESKAHPLDVYRMLRALNPSPYMYLLNLSDSEGQFNVVGSSPEALVRVNNQRAILHPIAGSRPRGDNLEKDSALADELLADEKEKAEHLMLVDLARNDLLKVCTPESVSVTEFMTVERYSHIMHLVSTVEGELLTDTSAVDVFRATFPAGTLSGAPKPRALEIIEELEPTNRGVFGGVVGYFDFAGNADLAIAIRTAFLRNNRGYVQAGAGIVLDSDPNLEYQETISKASAPLRAILAANRLKRIEN
jgi:anthranilate synthase component I